MADLILSGRLNLSGSLNLEARGGVVTVDGVAVLVEGLVPPTDGARGTAAVPVMLPPPPVGPVNPWMSVVVISSLNKTVKAGGKNIVALGIVMQGDPPQWPGMMLPSKGTVTINTIPINVQGDQATIFPSGGVGTFTQSGQV